MTAAFAIRPHPARRFFARIDQLLRGSASLTNLSPTKVRHWLVILIAAGAWYGAVMGTFGGLGPSHFPQMFYSATKVPLLLLATFFLSLPSFFVVNTLLGLRDDFPKVLRALGEAQAALTVILASLSPFTVFWYVSFIDYHNAILFNAAMFAVASFSAQLVLRRSYRSLIERHPRHRWMLRCWLIIYAFVGIQLGWVLRPFIGDPRFPTTFLRADAWTNAYVFLMHLI